METEKLARIDELEKFRKAVIDEAVLEDDKGNDCHPGSDYERGMDNVGRGLLKRIDKRIKQLS